MRYFTSLFYTKSLECSVIFTLTAVSVWSTHISRFNRHKLPGVPVLDSTGLDDKLKL